MAANLVIRRQNHEKIRTALETLAEKVGRADEECSAVSCQAGLSLICEGIKAVVIEIVVIAGVKGSSRVWAPAKKELAAHVRIQRVVVPTGPNIRKSRK